MYISLVVESVKRLKYFFRDEFKLSSIQSLLFGALVQISVKILECDCCRLGWLFNLINHGPQVRALVKKS
jgi:hypothetical protein